MEEATTFLLRKKLQIDAMEHVFKAFSKLAFTAIICILSFIDIV